MYFPNYVSKRWVEKWIRNDGDRQIIRAVDWPVSNGAVMKVVKRHTSGQ